MATISRLSVSLTANAKGLRRGLKTASRSVKKFTGKILNLKTAIVGAIGIGSMGALTKSSITAFAKQEQAVAKLDASIVSMKRNTKGLSRTIKDLSSQIQREGIIGDEALIEGASFLTTYKDITDALLPRTIRAMADLSAKMGGDTTRAANLLGKASMGMVGSLSLAGISLSDATKQSKDFKDILREIEEQVGGTNKALGDTSTGGIMQFQNNLGDLQEKLGEVIAIGFGPWIRHIGDLMGGVSFDAKTMGENLKTTMLDATKAMAPLADALDGLKLVWKVLKLAAAGFGLAVVTAVQSAADGINIIAGVYGLQAIDTSTINMLNDAFTSQTATVKNLKSEISSLVDDLGNAPPSIKFKAEIDKFALDAEVGEMKRRLGFVEGGNFRKGPAEPVGKLHKLEVNPKNPQIDTTNGKLDRIYGALTRKGAIPAVAG